MNTSSFFNYFASIAISLLFALPVFSQSSENQQIVFEGNLTDASGNPIDLAGAQLTFYVTANGCYLYGETSSTSGDSQGNIVHRIGAGSQVTGSPNSFTQNIFFGTVSGTSNFLGNNCTVLPTHTRLAQVYYAAQNISATIKMGTVPYAHNATMLNGKVATDFLEITNDSNTLFYGGTAGQFLTKSASGGLTWTNTSLTAGQISSALGYTPASTTATLTASSITTALGYTPANNTALAAYAVRTNNLSDISSATAARNNLGLGNLATKNSVNLATAEVTGTLPATNLPAYSGDIAKAAGSASATVQGLRGVSLSATAPVSGQVLYFNGSVWMPIAIPSNVGTVTSVTSSNSDISVSATTSTPILTLNTGTGVNQIIKTDGTARLPSVDASQLINLNATQLTTGTIPTARLPILIGDISSAAGSNTVTVTRLRGVNIASATPTTNQVLTFTGGAWTPSNAATGSVTNITAGIGLLGGSITSAGTLSVNFGQVSGTVAAGNDSRITGSLQSVNNFSDLSSSATARTNLGLGILSTKSAVHLVSEVTGTLPVAFGGTGAQNVSDARMNLGLGAFAVLNTFDLGSASATGTLSPARLPAFTGDVSSTVGSSSLSVNRLRGINISSATPTVNQVLAYVGAQWTPVNAAVGTVTNIFTGTGLTGGPITSSGTIGINFGQSSGTVAAGNDTRIVQALQSVNNLNDITSAGAARANLGLGSLATKNSVNLASPDVTGSLPVANGGSPWITHANGYYIVSNTAIGTAGVLTNTKLYVEGNTPSQVARFNNTATNGYGVRIDVAGSSAAQYALNVNNASGSVFSVQNDGNIGIGTLSPTSVLNIVNDNGPANKDDIQINTFGSNTAALALQRAKGLASAPTPLLTNDNIGNLRWDGYTGSAYANLVAISGHAESDLATAVNSYLTISTNSGGTIGERLRVNSIGNVGIGTTTPQAKLHVAGAVISKPVVIPTGTSIDLAQSNMFILNNVGGSPNAGVLLVLSNMVDGGTYTMIIADTVAHTYTFSGCNSSFYAPANSLTVAGTRSMFGLVTVKNGANWDCYINWTPGYQ